jgi:hypothetical protein
LKTEEKGNENVRAEILRELLNRIEMARLNWDEVEKVNTEGWRIDGETIRLTEDELRILRRFAGR